MGNLRELVLLKAPRLSPDVLELLLRGTTKEGLEDVLGGVSPEEQDVRRMNCIGELRALGFVVSGGRKGGKIYQIKGWNAIEEGETVDDWSPRDQQLLEGVQLAYVTHDVWPTVKYRLSLAVGTGVIADDVHEAAALQVYAYDLGASHTEGYWFDGTRGIVVQRYSNRPRFRIRPFYRDAKEIVGLAQMLGQLSYAPVRVDGISEEFAKELRASAQCGSVAKFRQAIYDTERIASVSSDLFNSRSRSMLRKFDRDSVFVQVLGGPAAAAQILDEWRAAVEKKQRQLSITRDYVASQMWGPKLTFLGLRDDLPICLHIVDVLPTKPIAAQIVEKSLNYSTQVGGRPGTADWNLVRTCQALRDRGIHEFNVGHIDGGTHGLALHKRHFQSREVSVWSWLSPWKRQL